MSTQTLRRRPAAAEPPSPFKIGRAMLAVREARERLLAIEPDMPEEDRKLYLDTLDGESGDAFEVLDRVMQVALDAGDLAELTAGRIRSWTARKARFERREKAMRQIALVMLEALGVPKIEREDYTISVRAGQPHVVLTEKEDEFIARHPEYTRVKHELNKIDLLADLKGGKQVDGAELSNPMPSLNVRVA